MASHLSISLLLLAFLFPLRSFSARSYRPDVRTKDADREPVLEFGHSTLSIGFNPSRAVQLSRRPRAFLYEGFLSDEECDDLISLAHGKLEKSMVVDRDTGKSVVTPYRTSSGMFLAKDQLPVDMAHPMCVEKGSMFIWRVGAEAVVKVELFDTSAECEGQCSGTLKFYAWHTLTQLNCPSCGTHFK